MDEAELDKDALLKARLQAEYRERQAGRMVPRKYGRRSVFEHELPGAATLVIEKGKRDD